MIKSLEFRSFIYIFVFFISFYFLLSCGHFYNYDESTIYLVTKSIVENGDLSTELIPQNATPVLKGRGGKYYSFKGIAQSVFSVPYYITGKYLEKIISPYMLTMIAGEKKGGDKDFLLGDIKIFTVVQFSAHISALVCCMFFLFLLRLGFSIKASILSSLLLGISTLVGTYSKFYFTQPLGCLFILISVYLLFLGRTNLNLAVSSTFLGLSILTRIEHAMLIPIFMCYIFIKENGLSLRFNKGAVTKIVVFFVPLIATVILNRYINYIKYGDIMDNGYPQGPAELGGGNIFMGLYGHLFSIGKSFFIFSPPLILAMFYAKRYYKDHKIEALFSYSICACFLIFYSKWIGWHGGWCWGGRHLYVIIPFLLLPIGYFMEEMFARKRTWQITVFGSFVLAGFFMQVLGMAPWLYDLVFDKDWQVIINNLEGFDIYGDHCVFTPSISPLLLHWRTLLAGKYIDFWFYRIYNDYGLGWTIFWAFIPVSGVVWSARGIFKIMNSSSELLRLEPKGLK